MEENIYMLSDGEIRRRLGQKIKRLRLRQDFTQASLAEQAQVSLTTLKKIEKGDISYFDSLMRVLRILGELDVFSPLIKEDEMSPNEYFEFVEASKKKQRKRASGNNKTNPQNNTEVEKSVQIDPCRREKIAPLVKIRLTPKKSWRRGSI